jgi:hypothetical protein
MLRFSIWTDIAGLRVAVRKNPRFYAQKQPAKENRAGVAKVMAFYAIGMGGWGVLRFFNLRLLVFCRVVSSTMYGCAMITFDVNNELRYHDFTRIGAVDGHSLVSLS